MSAAIDLPAAQRATIAGIQPGEIIKITRHQHNQHSWHNPFERRGAAHLPEDFTLERPRVAVDALVDPGSEKQ